MDNEWLVVRGRGGATRWGARGALAVLIFGSIFSVLGLCFLGVGCATALVTRQFLSKSVPVQGTVTALREVNNAQSDAGNHTTTFAPVFRFVSQDGRSYSITSHSSSNPPAFQAGQTVRVLYDPADPAGARIDSFWELWGIAGIFSTIGGVFTLMGMTALVIGGMLRRRERGQTYETQPWRVNSDGTAIQPDTIRRDRHSTDINPM